MDEMLEKLNRRNIPFKTGEIFPADTVPVIANNKALIPTPFVMQWGYPIEKSKRIINARSETASRKPMFSDGMKNRRCLIPANHYFEWTHNTPEKVKYAIRPQNTDHMFMAGIYRPTTDGAVFSVLTREPAAQIAFIHNRMPVILDPDIAKAWLDLRYDPDDLISQATTDVLFFQA